MVFKSINYCRNIEGKDWALLKYGIRLNDTNNQIIFDCFLILYRHILYLENDQSISKVGSMSLPFTFRGFTFLVKLIFSRKTLGSYMERYMNENHVIGSTDILPSFFNLDRINFQNILNKDILNRESRVFLLYNEKVKIYVEENW